MRKKLLIISVLLVGVLLVVFLSGFKNQGKGTTHTVVLSDDGFHPETIKLKKGDTITFKTTTGTPFWPASDIHPTHGIYPAFDPQDAVMPDKTWSFRFLKTGKWNFHDHLSPYFTGTIVVN